MNTIYQIYRAFCTAAVFRGMQELPLFARFTAFARAAGIEQQLCAYGALVAEIYEGGGDLTACVRHALFENENIYVKTVGSQKSVPECVRRAAEAELLALSRFASLTPADFAAHMGLSPAELPSFSSCACDLCAEYEARVASVERFGYGIFALGAMFSVRDDGTVCPIVSADRTALADFIGYREERERVLHNTRAFIEGRSAANVLLYGDAGTGKSSTVKAIVNHFFDQGLRLIELRKNQLLLLPRVMAEINGNPLKFIIFIDDLSFNQNDDSFSMLKATLEGSASAKAPNAVIYATSNRRHIVKESFSDRDGDDVHRNDTVQETLSLSERFGLCVMFGKPEKRLYLEIVHELAARHGVTLPEAELDTRAEAFALRRGYRSARCAEQFIESLL